MPRDYDACTYYKYDAGKLLVGAEPRQTLGYGGHSEDFCFDEIAGDFDHFEPVLHDAMRRLPALEQAGIRKFPCPESFTPDVRYHLGEAPELKNCFVAVGLNSIGLQSGRCGQGHRRGSATALTGGFVGSRCPAQHAVSG